MGTAVLLTTDDNYNYLINGQAMSAVEAFIADEANAYGDYIEVCTVCVCVIYDIYFSLFNQPTLPELLQIGWDFNDFSEETLEIVGAVFLPAGRLFCTRASSFKIL